MLVSLKSSLNVLVNVILPNCHLIALSPCLLPLSLNTFLLLLGKSPRPWTGPGRSCCKVWSPVLCSPISPPAPLTLRVSPTTFTCQAHRHHVPSSQRVFVLNCSVSLENGPLLLAAYFTLTQYLGLGSRATSLGTSSLSMPNPLFRFSYMVLITVLISHLLMSLFSYNLSPTLDSEFPDR